MFLANLRLFWLRGIKTLLWLLAVSLAAMLLCAALVSTVNSLFAGTGFEGIRLAVADEEQNPQLEMLLDVLASDEGVENYAEIEMVPVAEAEAMVQSGEATAALILPEGFLDSVMTGENLSPTLILDASKPLEAFLVTSVAQSAVDMLADAQNGIQLVLHAYGTSGLPIDENTVTMGINLEYARFALGRSGMYQQTLVAPTSSLPLLPHYLLGSLLFFALLATPLLLPVLNRRQTAGWRARLQSAGVPLYSYTLAGLVFAVFAMALVLLVLLCGATAVAGWLGQSAGFGGALVPGYALCAVCLGLCAYLFCNAGPAFATVGTSFFAAVACLYVAGGIVPPALLPEGISRFSAYSPLTWMRGAIAPLYGYDSDPLSLTLLAALCAVLLVACLVIGSRRRRA